MLDNFLLLDPNSNKWIDAIDPKWMGSIPITIFYRGDKKRKFIKAPFVKKR
jgi:hypothetical protein